MRLHGYKLLALLKKDIKMMLSNKNIIFIVFLPILFASLYQYLYVELIAIQTQGVGNYFVLMLCSLLNISALPLSALSMMVAEEKEKNTMRTLLLADVSSLEFLLSKVLVVLGTIEITAICVFIITNNPIPYLPAYLFVTTLVSIAVLMLGAVVGIVAKDQMSTGTVASPLMILFLIPPMFANMNETIAMIARWIPSNGYSNAIISIVTQGVLFSNDLIYDYVVMFVWIVLGILIFALIYRKKGIDN